MRALRLVALLSVLLPLLAFAVVGYYRLQQLHEETGVRLNRTLRIAQEHALKVLDTTETLLGRVQDSAAQTSTALAARQSEVHEQLRAMASNRPQLQGIWIFGPNGHPLVSSRFFPAPDVDASDRDYFAYHQRGNGGLYVSQPLVARTTGETFFNLSRARIEPDGSFGGVLSVSLLTSYFENFYRDLSADEPGLAINMFRDDGLIYMRYPLLAEAPPRLAENSPVLSRIRSGQRQGIADGVSSVDGRLRLLRFAQVGAYPIYLGTGMDTAVITSQWLTEMGWVAAFGLPPMLGLVLAVRVALRRTRDALAAAEELERETQARLRVEEALLQSQKLEALGRLTGGVAHDFNNALMVISNNLFLLRRKHPEADGAQAASIGRAVESATQLTRQLLAFSRRQALAPERIVLQDRLPTLRELFTPLLGSKIELSIEVAPDTLPILVDTAELELGLMNLAINARDAMPSGGRFELRAFNASGRLPALLNAPMVVIEAIDTGEGIPADRLNKVFEPFFTTKPVGQGTGLGLSQVYGLCQRAGGLATIASVRGQGTTVRLFFEPAAAGAASQPQRPAVDRANLGLSILLVEDNDEVAAGLKPVLEAMGCSVRRMDRATTARDWLAAQRELPSLLLTDVVMPGELDGVTLAHWARERYPKLKIVLMTGYAEHIDTIARAGFEIVPKPCSAEMLAEAIRKVEAGASTPAGRAPAGR